LRGPFFGWLLLLRPFSDVVVCELYANVTSVLSLEGQLMPDVVLPSSWLDHVGKIDPCFAYQFRLLVVVEYRALELVVVGRIVNVEAEFLVPTVLLAS